MKSQYETALATGAATIVLAGATVTLKPTLGAAMAINRAFGGFMPAQQRILMHDFEAVAIAIAAGTGRSEAFDEVLGEVFETGLDELIGPVGNYVAALASGGGTDKTAKGSASRGKD